jgi:Transposase protein
LHFFILFFPAHSIDESKSEAYSSARTFGMSVIELPSSTEAVLAADDSLESSNSQGVIVHSSAMKSTSGSADTENLAVLRAKYDKLLQQHERLNQTYNGVRRKYNTALRKIRKLSKNKVHFEHIVGKFLNHDQLSALCKRSTRGSKWSSVTIKNALKLHFACGPTGYAQLLSQRYPLPSRRTLLRSLQHVQFESGILSEVFQYLSIKTSAMKIEERECCLTLDEMCRHH